MQSNKRTWIIVGLVVACVIGGVAGFLSTQSVPKANGKGVVSIAFDDGWRSAYENGLPILNEKEIKSTQYIMTANWSDPYDPNYIKPAQVLEMYHAGHEIGAHTRTHPHLQTLTPDQARLEISGSKSDLERLGISVSTFAYPFGEYNNDIIQVVKDAGFIGARSMWHDFNTSSTDRYTLKSESVENTTSFSQVKQWIDQAIQSNSWLILTFHRIDDSNTQYAIPVEEFRNIIAYIGSTGVRTVTVKEGIETIMK